MEEGRCRWMEIRENMSDELRGQNKNFNVNHDRITLTHQKLRIKITKAE